MEARPSQGHDQPVFKATIEVPYHAIKKNSRPIFKNKRTGRAFLGKSQRLVVAENVLVHELRLRAISDRIEQPIESRLRCMLTFGYPPNVFYTGKKKLQESKRLGDCTNLSQAVEDALQSAGIIKNDRQLAPITIDRVCTDTHQVHIELFGHE